MERGFILSPAFAGTYDLAVVAEDTRYSPAECIGATQRSSDGKP